MKYHFLMASMLFIYSCLLAGMSHQELSLQGLSLKELQIEDAGHSILYIRQDSGCNLIDLSGHGLTDIAGIDSLPVEFENKIVAFKDVPKAILRLNNNQLRALPAEIAALSNLTALDISHNQLEQLPNLGKSKQLQRINASFNRLASLPASLWKNRELKYLQADHNEISSLPENFGDCERLTHCSLVGNKIAFLPKSFSKLAKLTHLNLESNNLSDNDLDLILHCKKLIHLQVSYNSITRISDEIGGLRKLRKLLIRNNQLENISKNICFLKLEVLDVSFNQLQNESIPDEIKTISTLVTCAINNNKFLVTDELLAKLPESITHLNVSGNLVASLDRLGRFIHLATLIIHDCSLSSLPAELSALTELTTCDIRQNKLEITDNFVEKLPLSLHVLRVSGNKIMSSKCLKKFTKATAYIPYA